MVQCQRFGKNAVEDQVNKSTTSSLLLPNRDLGPARLHRFLDVSNGKFLYLDNFGFLSQKLWFVTEGAARHKFRP